jgi:MFS family permease
MHTRAPWFPLIVIVLAQLQLNMNVSVLPVSLGPISEDLAAPATAAATALLLYSLFVAAFVMLGAKIGKLGGERRVFQAGVVVYGVPMGLMATSTDASVMNIAQAITGVSAAALVPTFVVLIAAMRLCSWRLYRQEKQLPACLRCTAGRGCSQPRWRSTPQSRPAGPAGSPSAARSGRGGVRSARTG